MKNLVSVLILCSISFFSCTKDAADISSSDPVIEEVAGEFSDGGVMTSSLTSAPYNVVLENIISNDNGTWTWVWSVQNPNPGNGNNGTAQDLSHWGFTLGSCVVWNDVLAAGYSYNGTTWTNFTPNYSVDPSQDCMTQAVLKFDTGTSGTQKTYYSVTLANSYTVDPAASGYYKSGKRTGCGTFVFTGIGCPGDSGPRER